MHWSTRLLLWHITILAGLFAIGMLLGSLKEVNSGDGLLGMIFGPHGILFGVVGFLMYLLIPTLLFWFMAWIVRRYRLI